MRKLPKKLAAPTRFELATSCVTDIFNASRKSSNFNHSIESSRLISFRRLCPDVRACRGLHRGSLQKSLQCSLIQIGAAS